MNKMRDYQQGGEADQADRALGGTSSRAFAGGASREPDSHITLSQAARIAPGGVSPNCVWRWCRRGVLARTGGRIRLEHIRMGGKLFTTPRWVDEFGKRLAEADAEYFATDAPLEPAPQTRASPPPPLRRSRSRVRRPDDAEAARQARIAAELDAEGL